MVSYITTYADFGVPQLFYTSFEKVRLQQLDPYYYLDYHGWGGSLKRTFVQIPWPILFNSVLAIDNNANNLASYGGVYTTNLRGYLEAYQENGASGKKDAEDNYKVPRIWREHLSEHSLAASTPVVGEDGIIAVRTADNKVPTY